MNLVLLTEVFRSGVLVQELRIGHREALIVMKYLKPKILIID